MSHFKINQFVIEESKKEKPARAADSGSATVAGRPDQEVRVVKQETHATPIVQQFEFGKLTRGGEKDYAKVKAKYGPLASTDPERQGRSQRDHRFSLNELSRGPLSVEDEERRVIEEKVRGRLAAISEQAKAEAGQVGYQDGLKKGYEEAFRQFRAEGAERLARLDGFLENAEKSKDEIFRANERFLMEMICRIGRMVLLKELATDREYLQRLARDLLERVGVRENITLKIHPDDAGTMEMLREGLERSLGTLKNLNIEQNSQVMLGGCMLETEWNAIDASIETQLKGVYQALIGKETGGRP